MRLVLFVLAVLLIMPNVYAQNQNENRVYNFEENSVREQTDSKYAFNDNIMSGKVVELKKGTELPVSLVTPIDTSTAQENDAVEAFLNEELEVDGMTIAEQGSIVKGRIVKSRNGSSGIKNGKVSIIFDKIITTENRIIDISTEKIDFVVSETGKWLSTAQTLVMVLLAAALTVCTGGAGAGVLALGICTLGTEICHVFNKGGSDVIIPANTPIEIATDSATKVVGSY